MLAAGLVPSAPAGSSPATALAPSPAPFVRVCRAWVIPCLGTACPSHYIDLHRALGPPDCVCMHGWPPSRHALGLARGDGGPTTPRPLGPWASGPLASRQSANPNTAPAPCRLRRPRPRRQATRCDAVQRGSQRGRRAPARLGARWPSAGSVQLISSRGSGRRRSRRSRVVSSSSCRGRQSCVPPTASSGLDRRLPAGHAWLRCIIRHAWPGGRGRALAPTRSGRWARWLLLPGSRSPQHSVYSIQHPVSGIQCPVSSI